MNKYVIKHDPSCCRFYIYKQRFWFWEEYVDSVHYPYSAKTEQVVAALEKAKALVTRFKDIDDRLSRC